MGSDAASGLRAGAGHVMRRPCSALLLWASLAMTGGAAASHTCLVSSLPVSFGVYDPLSASALNGTGQVSVTCTLLLGSSDSVAYSIQLSAGGAGTYSPRQMSGVGSTLNYNLYRDASRTLVWGDGAGGTVNASDSYTLGLVPELRSYVVYGRIDSGQGATAGVYADSVLVTLDF